jgi:hypothetical protein
MPDSLNLLRAFLLTGVLTGLLFSCGEGIRLFPFPSAAAHKHSKLQTDGQLGYQKNAHRFESKSGDYLSKIQRDNQPHYWTSRAAALDHAPSLVVSNSPETGVLFDSGFFKSSLFASFGASRAPPVPA